MSESWLPAPGMDGAYEVSDLGRVRRSRPGKGTFAGKMIKPRKAGRGYLAISASIGGAVRNAYVHQWVAAAFIGPRPIGLDVCHNNGDSADNRAPNLRYDTVSANNRDMLLHGTHASLRRTACDHGHEFTPENTLIWNNGVSPDGVPKVRRKCRECHRQKGARQYAVLRERSRAA